jgi:hypothetical protein
MFLSREYRGRAIGLAVVYAVLITAVAASGAFDRAPAKSASTEAATTVPAPMRATEAAIDRSKTKKADDCESALQCRSDTVC